MKLLKLIGKVILSIIAIALFIIASVVLGLFIRWFLYLICFFMKILNFILDFSFVDTIINWVETHDTGMWIIGSCISPFFIVAFFSSSPSSSGNQTRNRTNIDRDYQIYESSGNSNNITFADASGAYRRWGDDFIDCKGNWCKWGTAFYDNEGNYIRWGNTYQDISGSYRRWGDDFIDGNGDWVHL